MTSSRFISVAAALVLVSGSAFGQAGGGGGGAGGGAGGGSASSSGPSSGNAPSGAPAANAVNGPTSSPTLSNSLQSAPGAPNSQPNTYNALSQGSSANQMGTIGGSNSAGAGNAAPGSAVSSLTSTNTGVMAPSSNATIQPGR